MSVNSFVTLTDLSNLELIAIPFTIAVMAVESPVKYSFLSKGIPTFVCQIITAIIAISCIRIIPKHRDNAEVCCLVSLPLGGKYDLLSALCGQSTVKLPNRQKLA